MHPTYRLINKPLTYFGCDRRAFLISAIIGWCFFLLANSLWSGVFVFAVFVLVGRQYTKDPVGFSMRFGPSWHKKDYYDPGLRKPFLLIIHD
jgi:hypothetical protein